MAGMLLLVAARLAAGAPMTAYVATTLSGRSADGAAGAQPAAPAVFGFATSGAGFGGRPLELRVTFLASAALGEVSGLRSVGATCHDLVAEVGRVPGGSATRVNGRKLPELTLDCVDVSGSF